MTANLPANVQPYLDALAQAADADHASSIVDETTAARGVFAFTELLQSLAVQQLKDTAAYSLIELFAFGNWRQWHDNHRKTIPLNAAQELKLRQLSLLSLANRSKILTYASMQRELGLESTAELEGVIIDALYQEIIQGKLSQARQELALESAVGRDVDLTRDLPSLDVTVTAMIDNTDRLIAALDQSIEGAASWIHEPDSHGYPADAEQLSLQALNHLSAQIRQP